MGISMAICEVDSDAALCKRSKTSYVKVYLPDIRGYEKYAEYDAVTAGPEAKKVLGGEWGAFFKRNRLDPEAEIIYVDKIKNESDRARLMAHATKNYTGWVYVDKAQAGVAREIISKSSPDDRLTGWDMVSFDDMAETCKQCGMSWDKGRGCIGDFGPEGSKLPGIAAKYGANIIANVVESSKTKKTFEPSDAEELIREVKLLREKLPDEGKVMVNRYKGVLDRLEAMADIALKYRTKFYFV